MIWLKKRKNKMNAQIKQIAELTCGKVLELTIEQEIMEYLE